MAFSGFVSGLDADALESVAAELLRLLDGVAAEPASGTRTDMVGVDGETRRDLGFLPMDTERLAERFADATEERDGRTVSAVEAEAEAAETRETPGLSEALARERAAFSETEASVAGTAGAPRQTNGAARMAGGSDMDAISEFFRRDSRRYDTGFGE